MKTRRPFGFTLIEMLVVISILGILAGLTVPALKNLGKSNIQTSAARQLLDDVGRARQLAVSGHTTVYMVFCPTNFWVIARSFPNQWWSSLATLGLQSVATNLCDKQLTGYTFVSLRSVGDQPGQNTPQYLAEWQNLPQGSYIFPQKYDTVASVQLPISSTDPSKANPIFKQWNQDYPHPDQNTIYTFTNVLMPFPTAAATKLPVSLPCIAFNYLGQLLTGHDEYIPLVQGSVSPAVNAAKSFIVGVAPSVSETPPGNGTNISYNIVHIDALTGRATLEYHKVQ